MVDLAFPAATIITMISAIDRDPRGGAAQARLEIGPGPAPGSRRRVCVVSETYPPEINGVAMTLARLVDGLRGRGHAVSVVRPRQRVDRCGPPRDAEEFLVHGAPLPGYGGLQIGLPAAGALRRHWTRHRPDVVYVATEGPLGWSAVRAATRLRLPVVSGFHTNFHSYAKHYHAGWIVRVVAGYLRRFHNRTSATVRSGPRCRNATPTSSSAERSLASSSPRTMPQPTSFSSRARPRRSETWSWKRWRAVSPSSPTTTPQRACT